MKTSLLLLALGTSALAQQSPEPRPAPVPFEKGEQAAVLDADDPDLPRQVQVTVEFIEVPQAEATRLLYKEKLGRHGEKLREELQKEVENGKGSIFDTMLVTAKSGQKATTESIREVIYPTEYEPAQTPEQVDKDSTATPEKLKALQSLMTPATPTAFTTRNTGNTLEIAPVLGEDNRTVDLRFVPEIVFDTGNKVYQERKDAEGNDLKIEMPLFYTMRLNTSLSLMDGKSELAALLSPKTSEGVADSSKKVFVMVRADVVTVKAGK